MISRSEALQTWLGKSYRNAVLRLRKEQSNSDQRNLPHIIHRAHNLSDDAHVLQGDVEAFGRADILFEDDVHANGAGNCKGRGTNLRGTRYRTFSCLIISNSHIDNRLMDDWDDGRNCSGHPIRDGPICRALL
jgi:hypothetical protein